MLPLYLFCLVLGGGLLLLSILASGGHDADAAEPHPGDAAAAEGLDSDSHAWLGAGDFLSLRVLLYFLAGFGATGALLETLAAAPPMAALAWALATGAVAAVSAAALYRWVRRSESGMVPTEPDYLVGARARVLVPVQPGHRGKVVALHGERQIELLARLHGGEEAACPRGAEVVIVDVDGDTVLIAPLPSLSSGPFLE